MVPTYTYVRIVLFLSHFSFVFLKAIFLGITQRYMDNNANQQQINPQQRDVACF